jgi:hypothetical protein
MLTPTYLSQLICRRCHRSSFITQIEQDKSDWIARCPICDARHIVTIQRIENVPVLLPALPIAGIKP